MGKAVTDVWSIPAVLPHPPPGFLEVGRTQDAFPWFTLTTVCLRRSLPLRRGIGVERQLQLEGSRGLRGPDQFGPSRVRETVRGFQRTPLEVDAYSRLVSRATTTAADSCEPAATVASEGAV